MQRLLFAAASLAFTFSAAADWPRFLGPKGDNHSPSAKLPVEWSEKKGIKWKTVLPGEGWSSPVSAGGRIYCTTATDDGRSLRAIAVNAVDGKTVWETEVFNVPTPPAKHRRNSHASPTPILEGDRLYVTFGPSGTACLSVKDGKKLWENTELKWDTQNGAGGSPGATADLLLIACDGIDFQFEAALRKADGKLAWKSERSGKEQLKVKPTDMHKAYGTPVVLTVDGKQQSVTTAAQRLYALDPATGQEQWFVNIPGFSNVPVPQGDGKRLYIATGFMKAELWAINLAGAKGDVTESHIAWKQGKGAPVECTPLLAGGRLYTVTSAGIASCIKADTGEILWSERLGVGDFAATPLFAGDRVYFFDALGRTHIVAHEDRFRLIGSCRLDAGCMASPAVIGDALILRTKEALYRIERQ